ncbi:MAG: DUF4402 domain-containing protein [Burkholderiales bacterium]|nr:DUF4402 domain-containing protein [Burkholderiales bacterium]
MFPCLWVNYGHAAENISITEQTQLSFAQLEIPVSGSETITIDPGTGSYSGTGTVQIGVPTAGSYKIKRSGNGPSTSCTIDIQNINSGDAALTINNFTGVYDTTTIASFPRSELPKPSGGQGTTLYLGATAQYTSSVPTGTLTPSFDIVVTLQ